MINGFGSLSPSTVVAKCRHVGKLLAIPWRYNPWLESDEGASLYEFSRGLDEQKKFMPLTSVLFAVYEAS